MGNKPAWKHCACGYRARLQSAIDYHRSVAPKECFSKARAKREMAGRKAEAAYWRELFAGGEPATADDFEDLS